MANPEHIEILKQGVEVWNEWRARHSELVPSPSRFTPALFPADFSGADLSDLDLRCVQMAGASFRRATLCRSDLAWALLTGVSFEEANLSEAHLGDATLRRGNLANTMLTGTVFSGADLTLSNLSGARGERISFRRTNLSEANLSGVDFLWADFNSANLTAANLTAAKLQHAKLEAVLMLRTNLTRTTLDGCRVFGISTWGVKIDESTKQQGLVVTPDFEPEITVDDIEVAQFIHLLLTNAKIRRVIDTVGKKGVLLLGRFTEGRIAVLERLRDELRKRGYLPLVFNFDKPETKDFTETVRLLAGLSKFVIADLTSPKSAPYELGAIVSQTMIPFQPIIAEDETPFAMLQDLLINYPDRVFRPLYYSSPEALVASLDEKIIRPAEKRFVELLKRKADTMGGEHV
jgi:uncharacterized protein YjbI with pentapeptide repeats